MVAVASLVSVSDVLPEFELSASAGAEGPSGASPSLLTLSSTAAAALPAASVKAIDRVKVPSSSPERSRPVTVSVPPDIIPLPVTAVPPPFDEIV